jgi:dihydrofolate reductase
MPKPRVTMIAAASRNGVLSSAGKIPWHLPRDVAHFRARTAGHWLLLGRTTYEQMAGWVQPGQVPLVLTSLEDYEVPGGRPAGSMEEALTCAEEHGADELVVCGGGQVYAAALPFADEVILTTVDVELSGEVRFPELPAAGWETVESNQWPADASHEYAMTIQRLVRRNPVVITEGPPGPSC